MILTESELISLWLTIKLAFCSIVFLLILGIPLAWFISNSKSRWRGLFETIFMLPIVLPPTVIGFYLLVLFRPDSFFSNIWLKLTGQSSLSFSFSAMVIGSVLVCLPFTLQMLTNVFNNIGKDQWEMALTLRANKWDAFFSVILPQSKKGIISTIILSFAHVIGQFGLLLMIGGNIPGKTKVLSIAIYDAVETLDFSKANKLSAIMIVIAFICLLSVQLLKANKGRR